MARPKQSELGLGLDRRQLLAGTAVVTAAGIVPNVEAAEVVNSGEAASGPKTWVSENSALNVCAATARRIEELPRVIKFGMKLDCRFCRFQENCAG
jgi:hypothetical protein